MAVSEDYRVDISGLEGTTGSLGQGSVGSVGSDAGGAGRPWLSIRWQCCGAYSRVYKAKDGKVYEGRCPRCHRLLRVPIGPGGTHVRSFEAW